MKLTEREIGTMASALKEYISLLREILESDDLCYMEDDIIKRKIKDAENLAVRSEDF
jgi:hypothetical protein